MSYKRCADWDDDELGRTPKRQQAATGNWRTSHARSKGHEPRIKYKPHADSGVGKDFHSVPYPLTLLPKKTWHALNNGDAKGGVCSRCGKDRDSTTWQRKLFLVAERLSWELRTTSSQQREQNEVALWAINAELGVFDPAVDDDEVVIGGKHSRENEWYPYRNKVEAEMALRIIEKADVLTEMSWPLWKAQVCAALEHAEGTYGVGHNTNTLHQGESSASTRQPLGEISSNSSQSSRVSPEGKEKLSISSRSSLPAHANHPECTYKTLADFYALLDKVERTSPMGARYLEAYAERLHAEICKDCWFQNMVIDLSEDEDEGEAEFTAEPTSLGAKSGRPIDLTDSPPYANRAPIEPYYAIPLPSSVFGGSSSQGARITKAQQRRLIGGTHDSRTVSLGSSTPGATRIETGASIVSEPTHISSLEQLQSQLSEWFLHRCTADATAHIDLDDLFRIYNEPPVSWPRLGGPDFLPTLIKTFPGSRSKCLGGGTTIVEGVRLKPPHGGTETRPVYGQRSTVMQAAEKTDAFSQWLRSYYEHAPNMETPRDVLLHTYEMHCTATRGKNAFTLDDFIRDLRKGLSIAEAPVNQQVIRNIRLKPLAVSAVQAPGRAATSSPRDHSPAHGSNGPAAAQAGIQTSGGRPLHSGTTQIEPSETASQWLREHYAVDYTAEVKRIDIFQAYVATFVDKPRLEFYSLMMEVTRTFGTATEQTCSGCRSIVFKGLKPKQPRTCDVKRCTPLPTQHTRLASQASVDSGKVSTGAVDRPQSTIGARTTRAPKAAQESTQTSVRQSLHRGTAQDGSEEPPQQVTNWLWDNYVVNPAAEVKQTDLYGAYCRSFDLLESREFHLLMKHVETTFSTPCVGCSACNTMVFKGLKPIGSSPSESRRCTPPPSQQVASSSRTSEVNSGSSANQPVRPLLPSQQAGPSSVSKNTQNSEEATRSMSTTKWSRKWLLKHYVADTSGTIRCWATFVHCRNHCIRVKHEPFLDEFGFEHLVLRTFPGASIQRGSSKTFDKFIGIRARYSSRDPERNSVWLTTNFTADMQATIGVREIMAHWRSDFDLGTPKFESAKDEVIREFAKTLKKTFPQAQLECDEQNGRLNKFRGLRLKTAEEKTS